MKVLSLAVMRIAMAHTVMYCATVTDKLARPRQGEGYILYIVIKKVYGDILSCKGEQSLMGSIYLTDLAPQRTILIECTPIVCIHCFSN